MKVAGEEEIEDLVTRCRLTQAALQLAAQDESGAPADSMRRHLAGVHALLGNDSRLACSVAPELLACRNESACASYFASLPGGPEPHDYLAAAVVLTWEMDIPGAFALFRGAHDRAIAKKRPAFAVAARERLAHHAVLFGDLESAKNALEDAMRLASAHRLASWFARCSAAAARLALDVGDYDRAAALLAAARTHAREPENLALLAPIGAALAVQSGDDASLRVWTGEDILATALRSNSLESSIAATIALLCENAPTLDPATSTALRRVLLQAAGATCAVELFSLAARYGELEEGRLAADALNAFVAPSRKYVKAHALLARAHFLFRCDERTAWIDQAGDAARAFNAMGMRRWMNEAMLLLVRQETDNFPRRRRGRPMGSALTGREQQVAHLIRRGARNREVAAALQISEHTVERHVSSILGRLGLRSRWQIVDPKTVSEH